MSWQIQQRVNFYIEEFRPPALPQNIRRLLLQLAASAALMLLLTLLLLAYLQWQQHEQLQESRQIEQLSAQLETEIARHPPLVADSGLQLQVEQARLQLAASQKILFYLGREQLQQSQSVTPLVAQLGEQQVSGVWLQGFRVSDAGQQVRLQGFVDEPEKLSRYVVELLQRSAYRGKSFSQIDVQRSGQRWLSFLLDTEAPAPDDETAVTPLEKKLSRLQSQAAGGDGL
jgi:hypothetical protein